MERTEYKTAGEEFDAPVAIKCGPGETVEDFNELGALEKPEYDLY